MTAASDNADKPAADTAPPASTAAAPAGSIARPWQDWAAPGIAAVVGGALALLGVLLFANPGELKGRVAVLQEQVAGLSRAAGDLEQVSRARRRIEDLETRLAGLASLTGEEPLTRRFSGLADEVAKLQALVDKLVEDDSPEGRKELRAKLDQIGEELVRLDTRLNQIVGEAARVEARTDGRLTALETVTPSDLPARLEALAEKTAVATLTARVTRLEADELARDTRRAALALALANLTRAMQSSAPFAHELRAIAALEPDHKSIAVLEAYAETGMPTEDVLRTRFAPVARDVVRIYRRTHGKGFLSSVWDGVVGLFSLRPIGERQGTEAPDIVARTEQRLKDGDLRLAVQELSALGAPENEAAADWLAAARARVEVNTLVAELSAFVIEDIAAVQAARDAARAALPDTEAGSRPAANGKTPPAADG